MAIRIVNEDELLDQDFRIKVLKSMRDNENVARKTDHKKRYDIYKDGTKKYVIERLSQELAASTVNEMVHRTPNISFLRKIIDKKSAIYREGATRATEEQYQDEVDNLVDALNINTEMKKVNKALELHKNCLLQITPYQDRATGSWKIKLQSLRPYLYDVIEDFDNPEIPRVVVFSYFSNENFTRNATEEQERGERSSKDLTASNEFRRGDGTDSVIADSPNDQGLKDDQNLRIVWWSNSYHFITDSKGNIISDDVVNPIGELPFVNFAKEQDGAFWAIGGDDLVDGAILINQLLADLYHIVKVQGMGLFYLFGKNVPKHVKIGPNDGIVMDVEEGDPTPSIGFASSNPPVDSHMRLIEQYIAMLLSTNNLEPGVIQGSLTSVTAESGIHEMIRKAEITADVQDQMELFRDNEPAIFRIIIKWLNLLIRDGLVDSKLSSIGSLPEDLKISTKFPKPEEFLTEEQKLNVIQKRRDLGLDTMIDSLKRDNPDLTEEEAKEKLMKLMAEKLEKQLMFMGEVNGESDKVQDESIDADGGDSEEREEDDNE